MTSRYRHTTDPFGPGPARSLALMQGSIVRAAHAALRAAGEAAPEFEFLTASVDPRGNTFVRLSKGQKGHNDATDLRPGDRLYALLADGTGVYERTAPETGTASHHRIIRFDGTTTMLPRAPTSDI